MDTRCIPPERADIQSGLGELRDPPDILLYDTLDSTNTQAKRRATEGLTRPLLVVARQQTAGRGRLGRSFYSPSDTGLYMTLCWRTERRLDEAVAVTAAAAVAASRALAAETGLEVSVKWVNDLYRDGRKLCGILAESVTPRPGETYLAVGWGINLTTTAFPAELRAPAGSIADALPPGAPPLNAGRLCGRIARELLAILEADGVTAADTLGDYRRRLLGVGRRVTATRGDQVWEGLLVGVDDAYGLILETPEGRLVLHSGEISLRPVPEAKAP